ncbi:MAG: Ig-like domain-containing protein [Desulfotomaculum sp.]|nr:Ig-like domain-containing protein [Desulfotomaculum sp.]
MNIKLKHIIVILAVIAVFTVAVVIKVVIDDQKAVTPITPVTTITELTVTAVEPVDCVTVITNTAKVDIGLPVTVAVTLSDGSTSTVPVTWASSDYDAETAGSYIFTAMPDWSGLKNVATTAKTVVANVIVVRVRKVCLW